MIGLKFKNVTRDQSIVVTNRGYNLHKKGDTEVGGGMKVEYKVIESTSKNTITQFVCTEARFYRIYQKI